jgi:hypothetical protein
MAATVLIKRLLGTSPGHASEVDITSGNLRFKQAENNTADTNNPVPAAGTLDTDASVSYWTITQLHWSAGAANSLSNFLWWGDGDALPTGTKIRGEVATSYIQAVTTGLTFGGAGEAKVANYSTMTAPVNLWLVAGGGTYQVGAKKTIGATTLVATGYIDRWWVMQIQVALTAAAGVIAGSFTATWSYDEV